MAAPLSKQQRDATEHLWRQHKRQVKRERDQRDHAIDRNGLMPASEFARQHGMNPYYFRRILRQSGYKRPGNRNMVPIKDLEKIWTDFKGGVK
jgi:hypothetical protein